MANWQALIREQLEKDREASVKLLQEWVQSPSVQGAEEAIQKSIADHLAKMGLSVDLWVMEGEELVSHPYFVSPGKRLKAVRTSSASGKARGMAARSF